jgi:cell division protein FtsI/penicillin-binding protein 2
MKPSVLKTGLLLIIILPFLLTGCNSGDTPSNTNSPAPPATTVNGLGDVIPTVVPVADPRETAAAYLDAWVNGDHTAMYNMLTTLSKDSIRIEDFDKRYRDVSVEAVLTSINYEILQTLTNPNAAQVSYQVTLNSALVGPITRETMMTLSMENGGWRVVWDDSLILPELAGGNTLRMDSSPPTRGIVYDKDGDVLAADTEAVAVSVIPSGIPEEGGRNMLNQITQLTDIPGDYYRNDIFNENPPWMVPIAEVPITRFQEREGILRSNYSGIFSWTEYFTRLAYLDEAGAHTIGWVGAIPAEEADDWLKLGYPVDAVIGRMGIESWGQDYLAGKAGGSLFVLDPDGVIVTRLAGQEPEPAQSIYTTLDDELQRWAQLAIRDFTGAVVVLERDTGRILAMASSPTFDPNGADFDNPNSEWNNYFNGTYDQPMLNRATLGQYPPGSIFKLVTLSAALESGLFQPYDSLYCGHYWYGPGGEEFVDWTLEKERDPSGDLYLLEGLMRSCNPWFYQIGYSLYINGHPTDVADMARSFGFGSPTGLQELPEASGNITNPDDNNSAEPWFNAVQQAIGQSDTLITPLQAAVYIASFGNGGILYRPQLIERIVNTAGENTYEFAPIVNGTLPISENTLNAVREGLLMVITNSRGTAYRTFRGVNYNVKVYGKTGTAQTSEGQLPHAWFIGFTDQRRDDKPDIAIAVIVENMGDGSEFAAPIFRRLTDVYFFGAPQYSYPWESPRFVFDPTYFEPEPEEGGGGNP